VDKAIARRLKEAMDEHGFDALVAYSQENIAYGIGYTIPSQALGERNRQFALVVSRDGGAVLVLTENESEEAAARSAVHELRPYDEFADDPMGVLADALVDLGVASGRVGVEMDAMPADRWNALRSHAPRTRFEPAAHAFQRARMVKTSTELDRLREAARIGDIAQLEAHPHVCEGMSEREFYRLIVDRALANGAETVLLGQVAAGERSVLSNPAPTSRCLRRGDVVKVDIFVSADSYLCDTGRAVVVAEATDKQRDIWRRMQETLSTMHETIRPGVRADEVWHAFVKSFKTHGMEPAIRFLGHGLGLSLHEEPFIADHSRTVLEAGMVLAIEPIYRDGDIGFHLEDNLIVTETGVENMTGRIGAELVVVGSSDPPRVGA
jgi:Xaa-Pro aminopeptidase